VNDILNYIILNSPALVVATPLLGAFLTPLTGMINDKLRNMFVIIITLLTGFFAILLANDVFTNGIRTYEFGSSSPMTSPVVRIFFEVDGMGAFMALIAVILSIVAVIYSWAFMEKETGQSKYYTLLLLMTTGMLGMVLTGDMFNFFVFLEITSISSAALVAFWTNKKNSVQAAFKYIVISSIGALFVLLAIAIFYGQYNALNMAVIANSIGFGFLDKIALAVLLGALAMKAAIAPMHMWLPDAYSGAPSSVTVVIIGTILASLYGVFRVVFTIYGKQLLTIMRQLGDFSFTSNILLGVFIVILATITIIIGVFMALKSNDFKRMIGYVAVAEIGYMILAVGSAISTFYYSEVTSGLEMTTFGKMALTGGIFHMINDALDIGLLFLVAGAIYYTTKETSLNRLGGLSRKMKYTTVFFLIGLLAASGLPPMNGFASKLIIYQSIYQVNPILTIVAILCSIMLLAAFVKVFHSAFLGPKLPSLKNVKEVPKSMLISMGILAFLIIFFGLFPDYVINNIVEPAVNALSKSSSYISAIIGGV
jgi:multicomponent Na+:H+ antiporter subunit D